MSIPELEIPAVSGPKVSAIASYFGANRILAPRVGQALSGCAWVGIPFAGGMSEIPHIAARTILVNDLHPHLINLAQTIKHQVLGPALYRRLRREIFHPETLLRAQDYCRAREKTVERIDKELSLFAPPPADSSTAPVPPAGSHDHPVDLEWAVNYFLCSWLGQGGRSGTEKEFSGPLSLRWDAGGGDSNTRFRSAANSLSAWRRIFRRCNFVRREGFDFIREVYDAEDVGLYCDPPWVGVGDVYKYSFTLPQHRQLAGLLGRFELTTVVVRYGDDPLVRELYPESRWEIVEQSSRKQSNAVCPEILLIKRQPQKGQA